MRQSQVTKAMALLSFALLAPQALSKVDVVNQGEITRYEIQVDDVAFKKTNLGGAEFVEAKLVGVEQYQGIQYEIGSPELPVIRMFVDGDVTVKADSTFSVLNVPTPAPLKPSQPSWNKSQKAMPPVAYNQAAYTSQNLLGDTPFTVENSASIRGKMRKLVTLRPFAYRPSSGVYNLRDRFVVEVRTTSDVKGSSNAVPTIAFVIGAQFASHPKIAELEASKLSQGYRVHRMVMGEDGLTTDVHIRSALQSLLNNPSVNLRHALLIGDVSDVPSHRSSGTISGLTDHFYRAIDTDNYETDINGPDIGVGRLSVNTASQLEVVVHKILRYSAGRFARVDWLNHPLFVTTHDRWQVAEGTHNDVINRFLAPRNYDRVFPDASEKGGDKLYPVSLGATPEQIVSHMRAGRSIINFSGHGSHKGWEDVTTADVNSLDDPESLPYVLSNSCITGDFRKDPVFAETWQRAPSGAITFWGSMDNTYWDEDDYLEKELYSGMFDHGIRQFDLLHQFALTGVWRVYGGLGRSKYYWETYVTFGDPSLEFRAVRPASVDIEGLDAVTLGTAESSVRVADKGGVGIANANIVLQRSKDGVMSRAQTDASGSAVLNTSVFAGDASELSVHVFGSNVESYAKNVPVLVPNTPYYGFSDWKVNSRSGGVHPGESIAMSAVVENFGLVSSKGGMVRIESMTGPARATRSQAVVPALASRQRGELQGGLNFEVDANARLGDNIKVVLAWSSQEGESGTTTVTLPVLRGEIFVAGVDYGASAFESVSGQGDVYLTVKNTGNTTITNGKLVAEPGYCTAEVANQVAVPSLAPGQSVRLAAAFRVTTDSNCANGTTAKFYVVGTYQGVGSEISFPRSDASYLMGELKVYRQHEEEMNLPIPDFGAGLHKDFTFVDAGPLKDISIAVKVTHAFARDLVVTLVTPSGASIDLRRRESGAGGFDVRWGAGGVELEALNPLVGQDVKGTWKLVVTDVAAVDAGTWDNFDFVLRHW